MWSSFNLRPELGIVLLSLFVPLIGLAQSNPKPESPVQTRQQRKAEAKQKAGRGAEKESRPEAGATSTSPLALPFKRAWQYLTNEASTLAPSVDDAHIYLPLAGGRVICLDRQTGSLLWTNEPGGIISAPVAVGENSVYIATHKLSDD